MKRFNRKGQVWVETVIYTLIGLAIIGLVLAGALPKINEAKDKASIEQSIVSLNLIDSKINEVINKGAGNKRTVDLAIKKGILTLDSKNDIIKWTLDSSFAYSQPGIEVSKGRVNVTTSSNEPYMVELKIKYGVDIVVSGEGPYGKKDLGAANIPYVLIFDNAGNVGGILTVNVVVE